MDKPFDIGAILLEGICVAIMIAAFITGMNYVNNATDVTRNNQNTSDFQKEYATFAVYDSEISGPIAYTEVLECVYTYASATFPIEVVGVNTYTKITAPYDAISDAIRLGSITTLKYTGEITRRENGTMIGIVFTPVP